MVTTETKFAAGYERTEDNPEKQIKAGWIKFPSDTEYRKSMFFPDEVMNHPAKMNLWMQRAIIEYVSRPGDILLDPNGGTGSLLIGCLEDRHVILLEIEDGYHQLQQQATRNMVEAFPETATKFNLFHGDCRQILPIPCNHIIFSPPYAQAMNIKKVRDYKEGSDNYFRKMDEQMLAYSKSPRNLSKLNTFMYNRAMEDVYQLAYQSLLPGGSLTIVIKDRINNHKRTYLSTWVNKVCKETGFKRMEWYKALLMGTQFTKVRLSRGEEVVLDEDIIIWWKD